MVGLVRSTVDGVLESWTTYYRNSLAELLDGTADFAPIHDKAEELVRGSVLDLVPASVSCPCGSRAPEWT